MTQGCAFLTSLEKIFLDDQALFTFS